MTLLVDGELMLYGTVGDLYYGEGFTPHDVTLALAELGRDSDIVVRINSGGGIALDGTAIYNSLKTHEGKVTVYVDGIAASAASIIAMAGDEIIMREGTMMMIHNPIGFTYGDIHAHEEEAKILAKLGDQMAGIYAKKTGAKTDIVSSLMDDETWFSPSEAVEQGFATGEQEETGSDATAFDYRIYMRSPQKLTAMATAMATERNWPSPKVHKSQKETIPMPKKAQDITEQTTKPSAQASQSQDATQGNQAAAGAVESVSENAAQANSGTETERERLAKIMRSEEAKGRDELVQHLAFETDMTSDQVIATLKVSPKAEAAQAGHDYDDAGAGDNATMVAGLEIAQPQAAEPAKKYELNGSAIFASRKKQIGR